MGGGDPYVRDVAEKVLFAGLVDPEHIRYRQRVLSDCLERPDPVRRLYALAVEGTDARRNAGFFWFRESPDALLQKSRGMLALLVAVLRRLRELADDHAAEFRSEGFTRLFETLRRELDDTYLAEVGRHVAELGFPHGTLLSAGLGRGNRGVGYVLRRPHARGLLGRLGVGGPERHGFTVPARDDYGLQALAQLRGRGINHAANALAQSTDHLLAFFEALRAEVGFAVACLNLHDALRDRGIPTCLPVPLPATNPGFTTRDLRDAALALHMDRPVIGNDVDARSVRLVVITGANQGGKSTFLRSVGVAQLLMQAGAFVPAAEFCAGVRVGLFTHFVRGEDPSMVRGKLEEELQRMSEIAEELRPGAVVLCNESFSSTNEREGSEIAAGVLRAMRDRGVAVLFVTHLSQLARTLYDEGRDDVLLLRAERRSDGSRTFRMVPGAPLRTSFAEDSYRRIFPDGGL
jgi:MutS domain V